MSDDDSSQIEQLRQELEDTNRGVVALTVELENRTRQLEASDRRKNEFLAMLAHELRNPLAVIRLALDEVSPRDTAALLTRQVDHVRRLVDDLLEVSRVERGKISLIRQPVDLDRVVSEAVEGARLPAQERGHTIEWTPPSEAVTVIGDAARLKQVVSNLLDNASKYSPEPGAIQVRLVADETSARVSVTDHGKGLSAEELEFVFDLFAQVEPARGGDRKGLGIGLTLVRSLVDMHQGSVDASSDGLGCGATFTFELPRTARVSVEPRAVTRPPTPRLERRLLLVEDGDELRALLAARLRRRGLVVTEAADAEEALELLESLEVDTVVSDLGLPGMSGYELGHALKSRHPSLRLIALSGYGAEADRLRTREAGFAAHLVKPVELNELVAVLGGEVE